MDQSLSRLLLHTVLFLLSTRLTLLAEESLFGDTVEWWGEAVDVEALVALVTNNEFNVVVIKVFLAYLTSHILETLIPLLCSDISRPQT